MFRAVPESTPRARGKSIAKTLGVNATLIERIDFMAGLATFRIRPDEPLPPGWFIPGQDVTLGLNRDAAAGICLLL
ncbi:MAG: hypothetical protein HC897_09455 [Thermoanaerobaculia bacterium]|nr:hypothetical protein [Thermoanaerobaculia bacterium]